MLDELRAVREVLADLVVVYGLLGEVACGHPLVDRCRRRVGLAEERLAVDLADDPAAGLDARVRPDDLEVEDGSSRSQPLEHSTQDVHDVLGPDSSERPGEERDVEGRSLDLDLLSGRDAIGDPVRKVGRQRPARRFDLGAVGIERHDRCGVATDGNRQPAVPATELEHAEVREIREPSERREMRTLGVELSRHAGIFARPGVRSDA